MRTPERPPRAVRAKNRTTAARPDQTPGPPPYRSGLIACLECDLLLRPSKEGAPRNGRTVVREAVGGKDYDGLAAAHSKALAALSDEIAEAVRAHQVARK